MSHHCKFITVIVLGLVACSLSGWFSAFPSVAQAQQAQRRKVRGRQTQAPTRSKHYERHTYKAKDGTSIDYWLMSPAEVQSGQKYPLVLALHGRGGTTTAATVLGSEKYRRQFPCFVIAPVSTRQGVWARARKTIGSGNRKKAGKEMLPAAIEALESLLEKYPIDRDRIYVTGQSMGGFGTFGALVQRPDLFAAGIPVAGGWAVRDAEKIKDTPLWVFHGDKDNVVPTELSRNMVEAIRKAGGHPKYTEFAGVGHNSWSRAYASPRTWDWLFAQKRQPR
ncbi:MAG TPA: phospholipase [Planctomycetaceae bacterium]|nr:phospholipase [Planctomycetaceae bacterium]